MNDSPCPQCGGPLLPEGGCPRCLLSLGLDPEAPTVEPDGWAPPEAIGPYRILDTLGEGGMGVVYLAEQQAPIRRRVALKLIKVGMDTRQVIARFESERQTLALMNHPHVAAVLDAGTTASGRPYFVMEYVAGVPITEYCDQKRLSLGERLVLFTQACEAIQHAHQKGIIHRDVKPGNVLVTTVDGSPAVKVIDFGVAKATTQRLTEQTVFTALGVLIGTPAYMSPEQADVANPDVDTRTDVYSLGVLLYELAAGVLPFDTGALRRAGYDEILRHIREVDPPRPSTRVSGFEADASDAARKRRTTPRLLQTALRGDLDWIAMCALDKNPSRRYQSPLELAADLRRFLAHEPIEARPPSVVYRVAKLVRRHRLGVTAAAMAAISLGAGAGLATWQAVRATRAERIALQEASTAREVAAFLSGLFEGADPGVARGENVTARDLLERGRERIDTELRDQPAVRARLLTLLGDIYRKLGFYDEAAPLLTEALAMREQLRPAGRDAAETTFLLGRVTADRGDHDAAAPLYERARTMLEGLSPGDPALLADVISEQAELARRRSRFEDAETLYRDSLAVREAAFGPDHPSVATSYNGLGGVFYERGEFARAEESLARALELRRAALGPDHPDVATTLSQLATAMGRLGRDRDAEPMLLESVRILEHVYGRVHFRVAQGLNNLAALYGRQGRLQEATALFEQVVSIREELYGGEHPDVGMGIRNLGLAHTLAGDYARADQYLRRALAIDERGSGPLHMSVVWDLNRLADLERRRGNLGEAARLHTEALARTEQGLGNTHPEYTQALQGLARVALARGDLDEAERRFTQVLARNEAALGPDHVSLAGPLDGLGAVDLARGRAAQAIDRHSRALALRERDQGPLHPNLADTLRPLGYALRAAGRVDDARQALERAIAVLERAHGAAHPDIPPMRNALAALR